MNSGSHLFQSVLETSWQAAVVAVLVLSVQVIFRRKLSPSWRYGLWLLVVVRLMLPGSVQSVFSVFNLAKLAPERHAAAARQVSGPEYSTATTATESPATTVSKSLPIEEASRANADLPRRPMVPDEDVARSSVVNKTPPNWSVIFCDLWLAGVVVLGLRMIAAGSRFRWRMKTSRRLADPVIGELIEECSRVLRLRKPVVVIETEYVISPSVWGLWSKRLLLPRGSIQKFSKDELRHIFLHELAHVKRCDLEVHWLVGILQILHWFNPVLWFGFSRMRADRELATDALALKHAPANAHLDYGETILKVLEGLAGNPARYGLVGIAESKVRMKERLFAIANRSAIRPWRWAAAGLAIALAVVGLTDAQQSGALRHTDEKHFTLRVMDPDSKMAMSGVTVRYTLDYFGGKSINHEVTTGSDGRANVEFPSTDLKRFSYQAQRSDRPTLRGHWFDQQISVLTNEYEVGLPPADEIGGTVTDENGQPVAGAEISFDQGMCMLLSAGRHGSTEAAEIWNVDPGERIGTTDAAGHWQAKCIWRDVTWASLRIHHPDFADATCSTDLTKAMEAEGKGMEVAFADLKLGKATVKLTKGTTINGRVVDAAGTPVSGVLVACSELMVQPHAMSDRLSGQRTATTDTAGKFRFAHTPARLLYFSVQAPGYAPAYVVRDPKSPTDAEVELRLTKGRDFRGMIVDDHDRAVVGARVSMADSGVWRGIHWDATSDSGGRIEWPIAPTDQFLLTIEKDGYIQQRKIVALNVRNELRIRLNPVLRISGKVLDAETKQPLKDFRIEWLDRSDPKDFENGYPVALVPGSNGIYSLDMERLYATTWFNGYAFSSIFRVKAEGYAPVTSRLFDSSKHDVGDVSYDVELKRAAEIFGKVLDADGQPVKGAQVALAVPSAKLLLGGQPAFSFSAADALHLTDSSGAFRLTTDPAARALVAVSEKGYGMVAGNELSTNLTVRLQPWGSLEGLARDDNGPVTNQEIWASGAGALSMYWPRSLGIEFRTNTDGQGRFAFHYLPPGKYRVFRMMLNGHGANGGPAETVSVDPGATMTVSLIPGGDTGQHASGRRVIGRFKITNPYVPIEWDKDQGSKYASSIGPEAPKDVESPEEMEAWLNRPEIKKANEERRSYSIQVAADGSFHIDGVIPGKYTMGLQVYDPRDSDAFAYSKYIINTSKSFEVPHSDSHEPVDLGEIQIALKPDFKNGKAAAAEFEATDMEGKKFKLSNFRGKYVLLDFWATWCGPCVAQIPYLRQVQEKFKDRKDFAIVSISLDKSLKEPQDFLKKNNVPWTQGYLGWGNIPDGYGIEGIPAVFLVNPEGKIVEMELDGPSMLGHVGSHLR